MQGRGPSRPGVGRLEKKAKLARSKIITVFKHAHAGKGTEVGPESDDSSKRQGEIDTFTNNTGFQFTLEYEVRSSSNTDFW